MAGRYSCLEANVDLDGGVLAVRRQRVQLGWEVIEDDPKSDAGERTIALDAGTVAALRVYQRAQLTELLAWGPAWWTPARCSPGRTGSRCTPPPSPTGSRAGRRCRPAADPAARPAPRRGVAHASERSCIGRIIRQDQ
ncbi:MAG: hypothetical protein ACRDSF_03145 [Pseudonocardiaceae bacterium]